MYKQLPTASVAATHTRQSCAYRGSRESVVLSDSYKLKTPRLTVGGGLS